MIDWNGLVISILGASLLLALFRISKLNSDIKELKDGRQEASE